MHMSVTPRAIPPDYSSALTLLDCTAHGDGLEGLALFREARHEPQERRREHAHAVRGAEGLRREGWGALQSLCSWLWSSSQHCVPLHRKPLEWLRIWLWSCLQHAMPLRYLLEQL